LERIARRVGTTRAQSILHSVYKVASSIAFSISIPREIVCPFPTSPLFSLPSATIILEAHFRVVVTNWYPARYVTSVLRALLLQHSGVAYAYAVWHSGHKNAISLISFLVLVTLLYYLVSELQLE
jgi:hypothetical protein